MHDYVSIIDNIFKLSNRVLCVQTINLFGERSLYRVKENNFNEAEIKNFRLAQFDHIVDNSIYLNFEKFIFTIFDHNGFKTMVINAGEYSLIIARQKDIKCTELLSLIKYIFNILLKDV